MERKEWLEKVRGMAETLYDHGAPAYWVKFGKQIEPAHQHYIEKFCQQLISPAAILDAACGAGLYDGALIRGGNTVLGIDQSAGMLTQAREHYPSAQFPNLHYLKLGLQEMDFQPVFDGAICMDAMEHICPEDWPVIMHGFTQALKPGGWLYATLDILELAPDEYRESYERARAMGLPVVFGEQADELDDAFSEAMTQDLRAPGAISGDRLDHTVYHFHPSKEQVHTWYSQVGLRIEEESFGDGYFHVLARKK